MIERGRIPAPGDLRHRLRAFDAFLPPLSPLLDAVQATRSRRVTLMNRLKLLLWPHKDVIRLALQSAAAALLAYVVMQQLNLQSMQSWAIVSALFSLQGSLDATLSTGTRRLLAAAVGVALGMGFVFLLNGPSLLPIRLALIAAASSALVSLRPSLSYAAAGAAVVAIQPTADMDGAIGTAVAVGVGGAAGIIASVSIWPELGRHRAQRSLAQAVRHCKKLIDFTLDGLSRDLTENEEQEQRDLRQQALMELENARSISEEVRFRQYLRMGGSIQDFTLETEKLWYSLVIIERVIAGRDHIDTKNDEDIIANVKEAHAALGELLLALADMIEKNSAEAPPPALWDRYQAAQEKALGCLAHRDGARDSADERLTQTLFFGVAEIGRVVSEFQTLIAEGPKRMAAAAAS